MDDSALKGTFGLIQSKKPFPDLTFIIHLTRVNICIILIYVNYIYQVKANMCDDQKNSPIEGECHCKVERVPNFAQPRLLLELAKKPAHGYELLERLGQEGSAVPDPGNFYRMLRSLEEEELVCSTWDTQNTGPARRVYELTAQGLEFLQAWSVTIQQTAQSLGRFLSEYENLMSKQRS